METTMKHEIENMYSLSMGNCESNTFVQMESHFSSIQFHNELEPVFIDLCVKPTDLPRFKLTL